MSKRLADWAAADGAGLVASSLFDWLVTGQVIPVHSAGLVEGRKCVVRRGKTPVLDRAEARRLLEGIDPGNLVGLGPGQQRG